MATIEEIHKMFPCKVQDDEHWKMFWVHCKASKHSYQSVIDYLVRLSTPTPVAPAPVVIPTPAPAPAPAPVAPAPVVAPLPAPSEKVFQPVISVPAPEPKPEPIPEPVIEKPDVSDVEDIVISGDDDEEEEIPLEDEQPFFEEMSKKELIDFAKKHNIQINPKATKEKIIKIIKSKF